MPFLPKSGDLNAIEIVFKLKVDWAQYAPTYAQIQRHLSFYESALEWNNIEMKSADFWMLFIMQRALQVT
jgi:hypothetical protein